eukprot:Nk52_evm18s151 gene=Nk52_evmTU18s151
MPVASSTSCLSGKTTEEAAGRKGQDGTTKGSGAKGSEKVNVVKKRVVEEAPLSDELLQEEDCFTGGEILATEEEEEGVEERGEEVKETKDYQKKDKEGEEEEEEAKEEEGEEKEEEQEEEEEKEEEEGAVSRSLRSCKKSIGSTSNEKRISRQSKREEGIEKKVVEQQQPVVTEEEGLVIDNLDLGEYLCSGEAKELRKVYVDKNACVRAIYKAYEDKVSTFSDYLLCYICCSGENEAALQYCDNCNLGFHTFCVKRMDWSRLTVTNGGGEGNTAGNGNGMSSSSTSPSAGSPPAWGGNSGEYLEDDEYGHWFCPLCKIYEGQVAWEDVASLVCSNSDNESSEWKWLDAISASGGFMEMYNRPEVFVKNWLKSWYKGDWWADDDRKRGEHINELLEERTPYMNTRVFSGRGDSSVTGMDNVYLAEETSEEGESQIEMLKGALKLDNYKIIDVRPSGIKKDFHKEEGVLNILRASVLQNGEYPSNDDGYRTALSNLSDDIFSWSCLVGVDRELVTGRKTTSDVSNCILETAWMDCDTFINAVIANLPAKEKRNKNKVKKMLNESLNPKLFEEDVRRYDLTSMLRTHWLAESVDDTEVSVDDACFELKAETHRTTTELLATCGGDSVCFTDCNANEVIAKYKHVNEDFFSISWTVIDIPVVNDMLITEDETVEKGEKESTKDAQNECTEFTQMSVLAAGGNQGDIKLISSKQGVCYHTISRSREYGAGMAQDDSKLITALQFHPMRKHSTWLLSAYADRLIILWDIGIPQGVKFETQHQMLVKYQTNATPRCLSIACDTGSHFLVGCDNGEILRWDWSAKELKGIAKDKAKNSQKQSRVRYHGISQYRYFGEMLHNEQCVYSIKHITDDVVLTESSQTYRSVIWNTKLFEMYQKISDRLFPLCFVETPNENCFDVDETFGKCENLCDLLEDLKSLVFVAHITRPFSDERSIKIGKSADGRMLMFGSIDGEVSLFEVSPIFRTAVVSEARFRILHQFIGTVTKTRVDDVYGLRWGLLDGCKKALEKAQKKTSRKKRNKRKSHKVPLPFLYNENTKYDQKAQKSIGTNAVSLYLIHQFCSSESPIERFSNLQEIAAKSFSSNINLHTSDPQKEKSDYGSNYIAQNKVAKPRHQKGQKLQPLQVLPVNHPDCKAPVRQVAISSSRNTIAAGNDKNLVMVWNASKHVLNSQY